MSMAHATNFGGKRPFAKSLSNNKISPYDDDESGSEEGTHLFVFPKNKLLRNV